MEGRTSNMNNTSPTSATFHQESVIASTANTLPHRPSLQSTQHSHSQLPLDSKLPNASRPRASSRPTPVLHQPQPIKDAVNNAFDQAPTAHTLDPEFMQRLTEQVTEQVIKSLAGTNLGGAGSPTVPSLHTQYPAPPSSSASATRSPSRLSPLVSSTESFEKVLPPQSPRANRDGRDRRHSPSPDRAPSDAGSTYSRDSKESVESQQSQQSTQSNRETTPRASQPDVMAGLRRTQTMRPESAEEMWTVRPKRRRGSTSAALRKDCKDTDGGYFDSLSRSRAKPDSVAEEDDDESPTTLERIWQPLFDNGNPTDRLGQFLRGLAKHIVEDYEPKGTVIPPHKLLRFLRETQVANEYYPWDVIFGGKMSWSSISMMYRKLLCEHHFIQQQVHEAPFIPALTPIGFEVFMTCMIQAHPDKGFERLAKAVRNMPISNADDCKERFPKELSRRLLPDKPNVQAEQRIISSLNHEPQLIQLERGTSAMPPPPPPQSSAPPDQTGFMERERNPYSQTSKRSNAAEDDDLRPPSRPIERERKPYFAREGTGKRYEGENDYARERDASDSNPSSSREPSRPAISMYRPEMPSTRSSYPSRQNSGLSTQSMYNKNGQTDPMAIPQANKNRMPSGTPPSQAYSGSYSKRRSPPRGSGFTRSAPYDVGHVQQSEYASNLHGPGGAVRDRDRDRYAGEGDDEASRYNPRRPTERNMNYANDDEANGRPGPPRNQGPAGHDVSYGPAGIANNPLINNFAARNGLGDERRRSWYPGMPPPQSSMSGTAASGTDGYGSYASNGQQAYGSSQY